MTVEDIYFSEMFLAEKKFENILAYDVSYKTFMGSKPLRVRFDKIDGFIKIYSGIRNSVLFGS